MTIQDLLFEEDEKNKIFEYYNNAVKVLFDENAAEDLKRRAIEILLDMTSNPKLPEEFRNAVAKRVNFILEYMMEGYKHGDPLGVVVTKIVTEMQEDADVIQAGRDMDATSSSDNAPADEETEDEPMTDNAPEQNDHADTSKNTDVAHEPTENEIEAEKYRKAILEDLQDFNSFLSKMVQKYIIDDNPKYKDEEDAKRLLSLYLQDYNILIKYIVISSLIKAGIGGYNNAKYFSQSVLGGMGIDVYVYNALRNKNEDTTYFYRTVRDEEGSTNLEYIREDESEHFDLISKVVKLECENCARFFVHIAEHEAKREVDFDRIFLNKMLAIVDNICRFHNNYFVGKYELEINLAVNCCKDVFIDVFGETYIGIKHSHDDARQARFVESTLAGVFTTTYRDGHLKELKVNEKSELLLNLAKLREELEYEEDAVSAYSRGVILTECHREGGISSGTGFIISADGYAITCSHCVGKYEYGRDFKETAEKYREGDRVFVRVGVEGDYCVYEARPVAIWPEYDMAIIKILDGGNFPYVELDFSERAVRPASDIIQIGFPYGAQTQKDQVMKVEASYNEGKVSQRAQDDHAECEFARVDLKSHHGNSGSPIISKRTGKVIGVLTGAQFFGEDRSEFNHIHLLEYAKDFIEGFNNRRFVEHDESEEIRTYWK